MTPIMAFVPPAPVVGRAAFRKLGQQLSQRLVASSSSPVPSTVFASSAFVCRRCLSSSTSKQQTSKPKLSSVLPSVGRPNGLRNGGPASLFSVVKSRFLSGSSSKKTTAAATATAAVTDSATSSSSASSSSKSKSFPETSSKTVAYWLLGSAASVFGIVVFGGLTRLTESGLSITEWRPVTGSLPPLSDEDWESEFAKYRASPEYVKLNPHMDLAAFKKIYFMEWTHRLWGRVIGLTFVLPTIYFIARRRVTAPMARVLVGISALIGVQGGIGWWMVASGLKDDLFAEGAHPRVSQYRLTAHLATAFVCYSAMLLAGLSILRSHRLLALPAPAATQLFAQLASPPVRSFRRAATALAALVFATALTGALVAGLDAGLIYNEFPKMGHGLAPPAPELWDRFYSRRDDGSDLWWRNMLENPSLVQLDHRIMAMTVCASVLALVAYSRGRTMRAALPQDVKKATMGMLHLMLMQVTLGISTLIYMVPTPLAAAHQAGALALLTGALVLGSRLRVPKATLRLIERRLKAAKR